MPEVFAINNFSFKYPFSNKQIQIQGNLTIANQECILLTGSSGSGKSTLLMALKGIIPHLIHGKLSGEMSYNGVKISNTSTDQLKKIGYLAQNPHSQFICHTVYDELAFGLENLNYSADTIKQKIDEFSLKFGISGLLDYPPEYLSGGQKQLVNLVAILLLSPQVLLLDEPTAFLDPDTANQVVAILKDYAKDKLLIIIEHNGHYFTDLITRIINIDNDGTISELAPNSNYQPPLIPNHKKLPAINKDQPPLIEIANLNYGYPHQPLLLHNLNFKASAGEIIGITGANGQGKSTLFKLICGLLVSAEAIKIDQQPLKQLKPQQLWQKIALLWQNPELHFIYQSVTKELDHDKELAKLLNLANMLNHNPFNLSEGQKRRLSLGIVAKSTSKILLLDEPTFGQDLANKQQLMHLIQEYAAQGRLVIIISHDHDFLRQIAHKTYQLSAGNLTLCTNH